MVDEVEPEYEILYQEDYSPCEFIERVARTCYQSYGMGDKTPEEFVKMLIKRDHTAMLEHFMIPLYTRRLKFRKLRYTEGNYIDGGGFIISANARTWRNIIKPSPGYDGGYMSKKNTFIISKFLKSKFPGLFYDIKVPEWHDDNKYKIKYVPQRMIKTDKHKNLTVVFKGNRGFTHEIVRMRRMSFAQESTRYCDYTKYGGGLNVVYPQYNLTRDQREIFEETYDMIEENYGKLRELDLPAQITRNILPIGIKAEIVVSGRKTYWDYLLNLRSTDNCHPDMYNIIRDLKEDLN